MTAPAGDSDSDDHYLPEKEPEFIIHIVDDHCPPAPPSQMYRPPATICYHSLPPLAQQQLQHDGDGDGPKECTYFFFIKCLLFSLLIGTVVATLCPATRLPKEYKTGDQVFILVGPIVIGGLAFVWILIAIFVDRERC